MGEQSRQAYETAKLKRLAFEEQLRFYQNANRDRERGRIGRGLALIIFAVIIAGYLQQNWLELSVRTGITINNTSLIPLPGIPFLQIGLGTAMIFCLVSGIILLLDSR